MADIEKGYNPEELHWDPPKANEDGSPIDGPLSYNVYRAGSEEELISAPEHFYTVVGELQEDGTYRAPLGQFPPGRHVIAMTAVDRDGDESKFSNTLGFIITSRGVAPSPPVFL